MTVVHWYQRLCKDSQWQYCWPSTSFIVVCGLLFTFLFVYPYWYLISVVYMMWTYLYGHKSLSSALWLTDTFDSVTNFDNTAIVGGEWETWRRSWWGYWSHISGPVAVHIYSDGDRHSGDYHTYVPKLSVSAHSRSHWTDFWFDLAYIGSISDYGCS